ncbi:TetR/AcrR family transcriptional regulator [Belnapia sp. T6]|uniref:TetR/AcrR family transcriptional regulator n=1 Tax=Belnapia mucosa TaxID=2804532 RepID=A0ABS1UZG0_9PROT|nr:TetR/AcrR family transcriptional regulator [Belnapia mucosa]MBL6454843.1 TetR/AcrR family transcriptional regulator [Belnapia mucosa]
MAYHHGALRPALLDAAETLLEEAGPDGLSLRAIARAAGVSHAAPAHHFGDLRGLLTALATEGFTRFGAALEAAAAGSADPLRDLGRAYVRFARVHPGLFQLMFRSPLLQGEDAALRAAMAGSFGTLARIAAAAPPGPAGRAAHPIGSWCLVHGFAMLLLDGRLPAEPGPDALLEAVLGSGS